MKNVVYNVILTNSVEPTKLVTGSTSFTNGEKFADYIPSIMLESTKKGFFFQKSSPKGIKVCKICFHGFFNISGTISTWLLLIYTHTHMHTYTPTHTHCSQVLTSKHLEIIYSFHDVTTKTFLRKVFH